MDNKWYAISRQPEQRGKTVVQRKITETGKKGFLRRNTHSASESDGSGARMMHTIEAGKAAAHPKARFNVGETVKVIDGPFRDFTGTVQEIKAERSRLRVSISVFGRPTPVDLNFIEVEAA